MIPSQVAKGGITVNIADNITHSIGGFSHLPSDPFQATTATSRRLHLVRWASPHGMCGLLAQCVVVYSVRTILAPSNYATGDISTQKQDTMYSALSSLLCLRKQLCWLMSCFKLKHRIVSEMCQHGVNRWIHLGKVLNFHPLVLLRAQICFQDSNSKTTL